MCGITHWKGEEKEEGEVKEAMGEKGERERGALTWWR
jgi:hypothetical protein